MSDLSMYHFIINILDSEVPQCVFNLLYRFMYEHIVYTIGKKKKQFAMKNAGMNTEIHRRAKINISSLYVIMSNIASVNIRRDKNISA